MLVGCLLKIQIYTFIKVGNNIISLQLLKFRNGLKSVQSYIRQQVEVMLV